MAKTRDPKFKAFGSSTHRYLIGKPLSNRKINSFERTYKVSLPNDYKAFLSLVSNGGKTPHITRNYMVHGCGAGPYYGLFPLGKYLMLWDDIVLERPVRVSQFNDSETWDKLISPISSPDISDDDYEAIGSCVFSGLLPIGHMGCSGWQCLALNGPNKGRVVYVDEELNGPPQFSRHPDFLSWYEAWLDGVISGPDYDNNFDGTVYLRKLSDEAS